MKTILFISLTLGSAVFAADEYVWKQIDEVNNLRISLAPAVTKETVVTEEVFGKVCKPVGMKAKSIAEKEGWIFKQLSHKNRNPAHALDEDVKKHYDDFLKDPKKERVSFAAKMNGVEGTRYLQRIVVQETCLACHGEKNARPDFIKTKYPDDKAFDFKAGDLRGVYSVFVPLKK